MVPAIPKWKSAVNTWSCVGYAWPVLRDRDMGFQAENTVVRPAVGLRRFVAPEVVADRGLFPLKYDVDTS